MSRSSTFLTWFLIVLVVSSFLGCAIGPRGELRRVEDPTEGGLRQKWNEYTVYHRGKLALVYKIKNDSKIELGGGWIEVTSDNMMQNTRIRSNTWVNEIIGENEKMFGYLVYDEKDNVHVGIVGANTVKLSYYYAGSLGAGP